MDRAECCAVYIDDRVKAERWVRRNSSDASTGSAGSFILADEPEMLQSNVEMLLEISKQIYLCHSGKSFASQLATLTEQSGNDCTPIFAFFDVGLSEEQASAHRRTSLQFGTEFPAASSSAAARRGMKYSSESEESYGLQLLFHLTSDIQVQDGPKLVVPVAILRPSDSALSGPRSGSSHLPLIMRPFASSGEPATFPTEQQGTELPISESKQIARCLDAGAVDVLTSPLEKNRVHGLAVHAYRTRRAAQKELSGFLANRKLRKHSWVGVHDQQPYAYLREAMVSKLMKGICVPEEVIDDFQDRELYVLDDRKQFVEREIGNWWFCAHDFTEDELVYGACKMLEHALTMPELEEWKLTPGEIRTFLLASRASYNSFVLYHNFRHAIDVLQSVFFFLLQIGVLPPYAMDPGDVPTVRSPIASMLTPLDALTLLIASIGHDVGHPGVNNIFLVKLNAPLAQLYNDNSVLEAFHCAAFSQILRRHWPAAFKDRQVRKLLISSILATDMGVHHKFMESLGSLQEKYHENDDVQTWKPQDIENYRTLLCGLLIKCADISNVARPWRVAEKWTNILQEEFANQGEMEKEVGMETALFGGPPELGNILKLATGQIGFMSIFALPLFEGVADLMSQMLFASQQIRTNQSIWQSLADREKRKSQQSGGRVEITRSPRSRSPVVPARERSGDSVPFSTPKENVPTDEGLTSPEDRNGSTISQVDLPESSGPVFSVPSTALVTESPRRQSSASVRTMALPAEPGGSDTPQFNLCPQVDESDGMKSPGSESSVLAAVLLAGSSQRGQEARNSSLNGGYPEQSESRRCSHQSHRSNNHHNHLSKNSSSLPSNSNRTSYARTQSGSTYTNTVMTPVSPATNATSFLTVDSGEDKDFSPHDVYDSGCSRPSSSDVPSYVHRDYDGNGHLGPYRHQRRPSHRVEDVSKDDIKTTIVRNGTRSPAASTVASGSGRTGDSHAESHGSDGMQRTVPRRRSRLRLAFWRRKSHPSHPQEVSGEL
ncbi:hypothetical protein DTO195F2_6777 [Paecilomyces variotii]|nr:hypothetical protein DTO195F2_6777 [Paecilomyces variotii]